MKAHTAIDDLTSAMLVVHLLDSGFVRFVVAFDDDMQGVVERGRVTLSNHDARALLRAVLDDAIGS